VTDAHEPAAPEAPEGEDVEAVEETDVTTETSAEPEEEKPVEGEIVDEEFTVHAPKHLGVEDDGPNQAAAQGTTDDAHQHGLGAELAALRTELEERTRDLQRVTAEYANYRKRVDRDRSLVVEQASANVLGALLPVLDDLDRAREHGDLVGPFGSVADQLTAALTKFGLTVFGAKGDPFDPTRHEAVAHLTSAEVTEPTCIDVMRRGYLLGERLLRPALVAVADPE
jgi:molecular chaperone GrpE